MAILVPASANLVILNENLAHIIFLSIYFADVLTNTNSTLLTLILSFRNVLRYEIPLQNDLSLSTSDVTVSENIVDASPEP